MADLQVKVHWLKKTSKTGAEFLAPFKVCSCTACGEVIYAPKSDMWYVHCYNCGAKFDKPVSAKYIKDMKRSVKI